MRRITGLYFAGSAGPPHYFSERQEELLFKRLRTAIDYLSGLQQGVTGAAYDESMQEVEDCVRDIAAGLLGQNIEIKEGLPYPGEWKL